MQDADLFLSLAEIAGVFVGFRALILVVLGPFPDREPALYLTAVGLGLWWAAVSLLELVFAQRRPQAASDPAALPAPGGSSA